MSLTAAKAGTERQGIIPLLLMHMALQHHEKVNGTGYPLGSVVLLSTGHIGVVTQEHWNMQNRPTLRLFLGAGCRVLKRKEILDLREHPNIEIQQVLLDEEVFEVNELVRRQA